MKEGFTFNYVDLKFSRKNTFKTFGGGKVELTISQYDHSIVSISGQLEESRMIRRVTEEYFDIQPGYGQLVWPHCTAGTS